jgi:hypothetical protein
MTPRQSTSELASQRLGGRLLLGRRGRLHCLRSAGQHGGGVLTGLRVRRDVGAERWRCRERFGGNPCSTGGLCAVAHGIHELGSRWRGS